MKVFYTVRDIEDMAARGEMSLQLSDDVVVTMAGRERAGDLGVKLVPYVPELPSRRRWREAPAESISLPGVRSLSPSESPPTGGGVVGTAAPAFGAATAAEATAHAQGADASAAQVAAAVSARLGGAVAQDVIDAVVRGVLSKLEERCR